MSKERTYPRIQPGFNHYMKQAVPNTKCLKGTNRPTPALNISLSFCHAKKKKKKMAIDEGLWKGP